MTADHAGRPAKQFPHSNATDSKHVSPANERIDTPRLHDHYKPVGISAVSAAAHYTEKAKKKGKQIV